MPNQPITVEKATIMMQRYVAYMTDLGVDMNHQTQSVSFNASDLQQWLDGVMPFTDEFRLCLGVYPPGDANAGRISVIVWPYKNGQPATSDSGRGITAEIEPFNEAQGHP